MKSDTLFTAATDGPGEPASREERSGVDHAAWRGWMQTFGKQARRARDFVGISQEQVARLAGVSQGAVSRLEAAQGLATPLLVVLKVQQVLAQHLRRVDPALLNPDLRRAIELSDWLAAPFGHELQVTEDPRIGELIQRFQETPERHREALLTIVRASVDGFKASGS